MSDFTQPEPINHNELRRLLCELVDDIVDACYPSVIPTVPLGSGGKNALKKRLYRTIEGIRLDGDDS